LNPFSASLDVCRLPLRVQRVVSNTHIRCAARQRSPTIEDIQCVFGALHAAMALFKLSHVKHHVFADKFFLINQTSAVLTYVFVNAAGVT
jgi:hypothetical protein